MIPTPTVSVVIPAYNAARYLGPALDSVLAQSFGEFETIVIDDGSTDTTRAIVTRYESRVRLLAQSHAGVCAARNLGIEESRAEIIAFLDADDVWHPDHLATLVDLLRNSPDAIGAASGVEILTADGLPSGVRWVFGDSGEELSVAVRKGCPVLPSAAAVRRHDLVQAGSFDAAMTTAGDWDLWLRLLSRGRFALAGRATVGYRRHAAALSMDTETRARNRQRLVVKHAAASWGRMLAAYVALHDARYALAAGQIQDAKRSLEEAGRRYPNVTEDLQCWAFYESFRAHDRPDALSRRRFWQVLTASFRVCGSRALPFRPGQRRQALVASLQVARAFARFSGLRPESALLALLARCRGFVGEPGSR
jgi:glycosyltransferase involved in cell wall biosynthesis